LEGDWITVSSIDDKHNKHLVSLLGIIALIAPFFFWLSIYTSSITSRFEIVGILWSFVQWSDQGGTGSGFIVFDPIQSSLALLMSLLSLEFLVAISRHQKGLIRRKRVWISALLSQLPMIAFLFTPLFTNGLGGPIPILLIIGLIIDRKTGIEPPIVPWEDELSDTEK